MYKDQTLWKGMKLQPTVKFMPALASSAVHTADINIQRKAHGGKDLICCCLSGIFCFGLILVWSYELNTHLTLDCISCASGEHLPAPFHPKGTQPILSEIALLMQTRAPDYEIHLETVLTWIPNRDTPELQQELLIKNSQCDLAVSSGSPIHKNHCLMTSNPAWFTSLNWIW